MSQIIVGFLKKGEKIKMIKKLENIKTDLNIANVGINKALDELKELRKGQDYIAIFNNMYNELLEKSRSISHDILKIDGIITTEKEKSDKDKSVKVYLKEVLKEKGVSMRELERETGITVNAISMFANQKTNGIQYETVLKIALYLGVEIGDIIKIG